MNKHRMPMSGPMIRAIQREIAEPGTGKTQTRRVMKHQPPGEGFQLARLISTTGPKKHEGKLHWVRPSADGTGVIESDHRFFSEPYGQPGDLLAFTETWAPCYSGPTAWARKKAYKADMEYNAARLRWRPPIFMPYRFSRITGIITDVRAERLLGISEADARAEGALQMPAETGRIDASGNPEEVGSYRLGFYSLWESIHGPDSWDENPFVFVYTFRPIAANVLDVERKPEKYGVAV